MIRVLLVDDQPLIRSGFRALLDLEDDIEVVAEAANGQEALERAKEHLPEIALVDIQRPVMDDPGRVGPSAPLHTSRSPSDVTVETPLCASLRA